jgi:hypothetical protein
MMRADHPQRKKREDARQLYLTGESKTNADIARQVGVKPHTIARWRREEGWDDLRLKVDRRAAEKLVEKLAGERTNLNLRHYRFWDAIMVHASEVMKGGGTLDIRDLERLAAIVERAQKGQRLARGLSLSGENEEQIRAQAQAEGRALVDVFIDAIKANVPDEVARERMRQAVLACLPGDGTDAESRG